ncbi:hypothetical protein K439DRAFT_324695 [Ramaria rubella]|nr:hypothetical protein K439DRAFT_324695 [Ramaria rubella]
MKTVRTRVKSALKRNSKGTPAPPSVPVKLPAASTSDPSILLSEKVSGTRAPPTSPVITNEKDQHYNGFRYESEPQSDTPILNERQDQEKRNSFDLTGLTFTGNEPERVYAAPQEILITDDSRRSTPKKRIKIQTTLPPSDDPIVSDIKFVSPVDPNYLIDDIRNSEPSLLDQPAPTEPSFVDLTPKEVTPSLPPLHEVLSNSPKASRFRG